MKTILIYPHLKASALLLWKMPLFVAQQNWTTIQDFKAGVGKIAGIIVIVSWLLALIAWFVGAAAKDSNPAMSKYCFYIVWMFAIGGPVVVLIFTLFVGSGGTPTPTFQ